MTKLVALVLGFLLAGIAAPPAAAHDSQYGATLTGGAEIPSNASPGSGTALVTVDFNMALASSYNPAFVTAQGGLGNAFNALVAGMENGTAYLNVHTTQFPGGEIRGLLTLVTPVPEPATNALMLGGLAALGVLARRRRSGCPAKR